MKLQTTLCIVRECTHSHTYNKKINTELLFFDPSFQSLADLPDAEISKMLMGQIGSTVRLDFMRGVAHHCVVLSRQALGTSHDATPQAPSSIGGATHASQTSTSSLHSNIINLQASYGSSSTSLGAVSPPNISPGATPPPEAGNQNTGKPGLLPSQSPPRAPTRTHVPGPKQSPMSASDSLDAFSNVREDDTVKKQLVDIARRLKDELEAQAHEVSTYIVM